MARGSSYTDEQLAWLTKGYQTMRIPELAAAFNARYDQSRPDSAIRACLKNRSITCNSGRAKPHYPISMTGEQVEWLKLKYKSLSRPKLTTAFNKHFGTNKKLSQIVAFLKNHKITCSRTGRYSNGHIPANKGTKGLTGANRTSFEKGIVPANTKPLWDERTCTRDGYILMKVPRQNPHTSASTRYMHKHVYLWEEANGPVPAKHMITFIDGDKLNCVPENLECISRAENVRRNQMRLSAQPDELKPSIKALAKLITKAHAVEREHTND